MSRPTGTAPSWRPPASTPRRRRATGRLTARMDLTGFSSWARPAQPARVAFAADRHLESVESPLMLGTNFTLRLGAGS